MTNIVTLKPSPPLRLYSAQVCPFAHRVRLALLEKQLPFERTEIDLDAMPAEFMKISPYNKVPLLQHGDITVWESNIILQYLDEAFAQPALLPADAGGRARARLWMDYADNQFLPWFYKLLLEQDRAKQSELAQQLTQVLRHMNDAGLGHTAAYWLGQELSLVDLAFYPFLERFTVLQHYRGYRIADDCTHLNQWLQRMRERPSVRDSGESADYYISRYAGYAAGNPRSDTPKQAGQA